VAFLDGLTGSAVRVERVRAGDEKQATDLVFREYGKFAIL
jgi:hypothetical protein